MIYVWRLDLDSNHDPRGDNLQAKQLTFGDWKKASFVSGVYPKMNGDKVSMLLFNIPDKDYGELRFVEFDFSSSTATGVMIT